MNYHQATTLHRSPLRLSRAPQGKSVRQHVTDKPTVAIRYPIVEGLSQGSAGGGHDGRKSPTESWDRESARLRKCPFTAAESGIRHDGWRDTALTSNDFRTPPVKTAQFAKEYTFEFNGLSNVFCRFQVPEAANLCYAPRDSKHHVTGRGSAASRGTRTDSLAIKQPPSGRPVL